MFSFFKNKSNVSQVLILPLKKQLKAWQKANRKMKWGIKTSEFKTISDFTTLTKEEIKEGFMGSVLCYGFGDDGSGCSDTVLSGKKAWEYAVKRWDIKVWQCKYIDFDKPEHIRLRPDAYKRPKGFYHVKFKPGDHKINLTASQFRKSPQHSTGCGPEGIQLLTISNPQLLCLMHQKKLSYMIFSDYDVAPHGFYDFYDAVQMFYSQETLGLGIGNIDKNYPLFGIPAIRFNSSP